MGSRQTMPSTNSIRVTQSWWQAPFPWAVPAPLCPICKVALTEAAEAEEPHQYQFWCPLSLLSHPSNVPWFYFKLTEFQPDVFPQAAFNTLMSMSFLIKDQKGCLFFILLYSSCVPHLPLLTSVLQMGKGQDTHRAAELQEQLFLRSSAPWPGVTLTQTETHIFSQNNIQGRTAKEEQV